jgi:hypothetical protein
VDCFLKSQFLVPEGHVRCAKNDDDGTFLLFGPGVHRHHNPFLRLEALVALTAPLIRFGNRTIVTVPQGSIGFATDRGQPVLLPPGMHQWSSNTLLRRADQKRTILPNI